MIPLPTLRSPTNKSPGNKIHVMNGSENIQEVPFGEELQMGMMVGEEKEEVIKGEENVLSEPSTEQLWTALHISCASLIHHVELVQSSTCTPPSTNPYGLEYLHKSCVSMPSMKSIEECEDDYCVGCVCKRVNACQ